MKRALLLGLLLAAPASAQVADQLDLQGGVLEAGIPASGSISLAPTLHSSATGGSLVFAPDSQSPIYDALGTFRATFGEGSVLESSELIGRPHLEVKIDSVPLAPRLPLLPAPQALYAAEAEAPAPGKVIVLAPRVDAAANGAALLAALTGITDSSSTNPYLVELSPGTYDLGSDTAFVPDHVGLAGAGQGITRITGSGSATVEVFSGASAASFRDLTIANDTDSSAALSTGSISGGVRLERVTLEATGNARCYAPNGGTLIARDSVLESTRVVMDVSGAYEVNLVRCQVTSTTGTSDSVIELSAGAKLLVNSSRIDGGLGFAIDATGSGTQVQVYTSEVTGAGFFVIDGSLSDLTVIGSRVAETGAFSTAIRHTSGGTVHVALSQVEGSFSFSGITAGCFSNYDESYVAKACP